MYVFMCLDVCIRLRHHRHKAETVPIASMGLPVSPRLRVYVESSQRNGRCRIASCGCSVARVSGICLSLITVMFFPFPPLNSLLLWVCQFYTPPARGVKWCLLSCNGRNSPGRVSSRFLHVAANVRMSLLTPEPCSTAHARVP